MAHKKAGGSSRNGRDSQSKRLGVKSYGGELITTGSYQSIDISNMAVERVLGKKARPEPYVL